MSESLRQDELVERATAAIRQEAEGLDNARVDASLERVRERLGVTADAPGHVLGCQDIQRRLPAFLAGVLPAERELLVADHTRTCIACRRALKALEKGAESEVPAATPARATRRLPRWAYAAAAAVVVLLGVQLLVLRDFWPGRNRAVLQVIHGALVGIGAQHPGSGNTAQSFGEGARVPYGQQVVTPVGQSALVRLADGSLVELRERTRFTVSRRRGGTDLFVNGGNVIVEAAHQQPGRHLWVTTHDCEVAVVGTVFAVDAGTRGSRVSVYEGKVHVTQAGAPERTLVPGAQATTSSRVKPVPLTDEVAWSTRKNQHMALLTGVVMLEQEMAAQPPPAKRFDSAFLDKLPATTVMFAAMPNLASSLDESLAHVRERIAADPRLAALAGQGEELSKVGTLLQHVASLGNDLGEELAVVAWLAPENKVVGPVLMAPVANPAAFRDHLESEMAQLQGELGTGSNDHVFLIRDPNGPLPTDDGLLVWAGDDEHALVVAPNAASFTGAVAALRDAGQPFRSTTFHATIAERYEQGIEGVLAVDLHALLAHQSSATDQQRLQRLGLDGMQHLVLEQWTDADVTRRQAVLSFDGARHGIAAWLAAPGPMGALSFFSPDSTAVAAFVMKDPALLLEDVLAGMTAEERGDFDQHRAEFQQTHGWDPVEDLAKPLGGEMAFGIDGPVVPVPSWKAVVEVYDPARLQTGLERLVADLDAQLRKNGEGSASLSAEGDGWVLRRTRKDGVEVDCHYRYQDGYLVATASAALLDNALKVKAAGAGLLQSPKLRALLPPDREINLSALWYQDLSSVVGPISGVMSGLQGSQAAKRGAATPPQLEQLAQAVGQASGPFVAFAYGEEDTIRIASSSPRNPLGLLDLLLKGPMGATGEGAAGG